MANNAEYVTLSEESYEITLTECSTVRHIDPPYAVGSYLLLRKERKLQEEKGRVREGHGKDWAAKEEGKERREGKEKKNKKKSEGKGRTPSPKF